MVTKKTGSTRPPAADSKGNVRVYIDLPADLARRFNILAATRDVPRRALLAEVVRDALTAAKM